MILPTTDPLLAGGVVVTTAFTDAVYVLFNAAVSARRRFAAATWSSVWYLLAAFAVITTRRTGPMCCSRRWGPGSAASCRSPRSSASSRSGADESAPRGPRRSTRPPPCPCGLFDRLSSLFGAAFLLGRYRIAERHFAGRKHKPVGMIDRAPIDQNACGAAGAGAGVVVAERRSSDRHGRRFHGRICGCGRVGVRPRHAVPNS